MRVYWDDESEEPVEARGYVSDMRWKIKDMLWSLWFVDIP